MEKQYKHLEAINRETREATLRLYGVIGDKIDGDYFGQEIGWLGREVDVLNIRINSDGGSVSQGLSIVAAIRECKAQVNCFIDGIAASMAAPIAVSGDRVFMNDYAQLMIHDVAYADEDGNIVKNLSPKEKKSLASLKKILVNLLSRRGSDADKISKLMKEETWFDAEAAKAEGLVDEIVVTTRKGQLQNLQPRQLVAQLMDEFENLNKNEMKQVIARFKLTDQATEEEVLTAIDSLEASHKTEVDGLKAVNTKAIDKLVAVGKKTGIVNEKNEQAMRKLAETDFDTFSDLVDVEKVEIPGERLSEAIAKLQQIGGQQQPAAEKKFNEYSESELRTLKATNMEQFKKLYKEYSGQDWK